MPDDAMQEQAVGVRSSAGELRGRLVNPHAQAPLVVVFRGVAFQRRKPNDRGYLGLAEDIAAAGFASLYVSFRGFGDSPGVFSMRGWAEDAVAIMAYAATLGFDRIALVGASGGAATALRYAAFHDGVVGVASLASPALMSQTLAREDIPQFIRKVSQAALLPVTDADLPDPDEIYADLVAHDPMPVIARISPTPILLVQGDADEFVSVDTARRLFNAAGEPKELQIVPGAGHVLRRDQRARASLLDWLKRVSAAR